VTSVKEAIEVKWSYPEAALRDGLEGKLTLEFVVLGNGELGEVRLIRSSGYSILDQEAVRAVKAASPFQPIPPEVGSRLCIAGNFEYEDSRRK